MKRFIIILTLATFALNVNAQMSLQAKVGFNSTVTSGMVVSNLSNFSELNINYAFKDKYFVSLGTQYFAQAADENFIAFPLALGVYSQYNNVQSYYAIGVIGKLGMFNPKPFITGLYSGIGLRVLTSEKTFFNFEISANIDLFSNNNYTLYRNSALTFGYGFYLGKK